MKIAYVYDAVYPFTIGGVEKRIAVLSERLAARGHEVHIFGLKSWEGGPCFSRDGVYYHGVGHPKLLYKSGRRSIGEAIFFGLKVLIPLYRQRFDIIDCQNFPYFSCFSAFFVSRIRKTPLVLTWHEVWDKYWDEYLGLLGIFGRAIEKLTARLSCNLVAVSDMTGNNLKQLTTCLPVTIIPNGIDFQHINEIQASDIFSDIIFVGRLIPEKKVDVLIKAVYEIKIEFPDIFCVIVGDGPHMEELQKLICYYHLENNVCCKGFIENHDEVIALMKSSKVFVAPSVREGFGIAALEAMSCGLPVVTVDDPKNAVKELVTDKTGIISGPSSESFAEAVIFCLGKKDEMRDDCFRFAREYNWEKIVEQVENYYSSVIKCSLKYIFVIKQFPRIIWKVFGSKRGRSMRFNGKIDEKIRKEINNLIVQNHFHPVLMDIGASGKPPEIWDDIKTFSWYIGFDPDSREIPDSKSLGYCKADIINKAVIAGEDDSVDIFLTKSPFCSSILSPDFNSIKHYSWSDLFIVLEKKKVPAINLSTLITQIGLDRVDWFKTDSQGTDLRLFLSIPISIRNRILAVDIEPGLMPGYIGEDLFTQAHENLIAQGFWISNLKIGSCPRIHQNLIHKIFKTKKLDAGALVEAIPGSPYYCEARYLRSIEWLENHNAENLDYLYLCIFALIDGKIGYALDVINAYREKSNDSNMDNLENILVDEIEKRIRSQGTISTLIKLKNLITCALK